VKRRLTIFVPHCSDLLTDFLPHGDGLIAHGFIINLARRGHQLHVAVQGVKLREPMHPNVTLHRIPLKCSGRTLRTLGRLEYMVRVRALLSRLSKTVHFDLVHQLNPVFAGVSLALVGSGLPLVLGTYVASWPHALNAESSESWLKRSAAKFRDAVARLQQLQADALLLTTPAAANRLPKPANVLERIYFLPHGVDTALFSPAPQNTREELPREGTRETILFLANVVRCKGIFTLLDAFPAVARKCPGVKLRIGGDGSELAEAKLRAARLPCADQVEFLGRQERVNLPALYRSCSVYCLPSFGEPFATTLIEAMSCGKPIVTTDSGGSPHIVTAKGGCCVPSGDSGPLSDALIDLLRDPIRREAMGRHNRSVVEASMSWDRVTEKLETIYRGVLSKNRVGEHPDTSLAISEGADSAKLRRVAIKGRSFREG
jgi:glycosyltransferase involved in cell wall biosynthesis